MLNSQIITSFFFHYFEPRMNNQLFDLVKTLHEIFSSGKAGTGKTTFLNNFVKKKKKKTHCSSANWNSLLSMQVV